MAVFRQEPPNGNIECIGYVWKKIVIFDQYLALSWKLYKIGPQLLWKANRISFFLSFFQVTTQLQYIEDSEPVVDGSCNRWLLCSEEQKQTKGATKQNKATKATKSNWNWRVAPHGRGATPYTGCRWSTTSISYTVYRIVPFPVTLNDPNPDLFS